MYCDLLLSRFGLIEASKYITKMRINDSICDPGILEAINSIIYTAPRIDVKELHEIREILIMKYGREFGQVAMQGENVSESVITTLELIRRLSKS
jgi:vacuolar protein sorting-associated protein IST1